MSDLVHQLYSNLRGAILAGSLPPGSPLSRRKLAASFGVSTLPVAAALQRLESEGFVESRPRAGTRVKVPKASEIQGNYILREALESQAARLFASNATRSQHKRILKLARQLDKHFLRLSQLSSPSREARAAVETIHVEFHLEIARATGCRELVEAIDRSRVLLFNWQFSQSAEYRPFPANWHQILAGALTSGSILAADEAMRAHVNFRREEIVSHFESIEIEAQGERIERGPQRGKAIP